MHLDLNNPLSIVEWCRVFPVRHWEQLKFFAQHQPQFRHAIREARQLIAADPQMRPVLMAAAERVRQDAQRSDSGSAIPAAPDSDEKSPSGSPTD